MTKLFERNHTDDYALDHDLSDGGRVRLTVIPAEGVSYLTIYDPDRDVSVEIPISGERAVKLLTA